MFIKGRDLVFDGRDPEEDLKLCELLGEVGSNVTHHPVPLYNDI